MNKLRSILLAIGSCLMPFLLYSQDARSDLKKLHELYARTNSYSMQVEVKMYKTDGAAVPEQVQKGYVKRSGDSYCSDLMGRLIIANQRCVVVVERNDKVIVYADPFSAREKESAPAVPDSATIARAKVKYIASSNPSQKRILFEDETSYYKQMVIAINKVTGAMEEVIYYYDKSEDMPFEKVAITYSQIVLNAKLSESEFSEKKVIIKAGNKVVPAEQYAGFEVIDQRKGSQKK